MVAGVSEELVRVCAAGWPMQWLPVLPLRPYSPRGARASMNWVTARRIMRIAHVVVAAATMAGRGQFFWEPSRAGAALASKARLAPGVINRGARRSINVPTPFDGHVLRALARGLAASVRLNRAYWQARAWPFALRLAQCQTHPLLAGRRSTPWAGCGRDR